MRRFSKRELETDLLEEILSAGLQAPSPKNDQPWSFFIMGAEKKSDLLDLVEEEIQDLLEKNHRRGILRKDLVAAFESIEVMREAPVLVFVCMDSSLCSSHEDGMHWELCAKDAEATHIMAIGACIQNMLLRATDLGVDSLWMGDVFYAYNQIKDFLRIDGCIMAAVAFGYGMDDGYKAGRVQLREKVKWLFVNEGDG